MAAKVPKKSKGRKKSATASRETPKWVKQEEPESLSTEQLTSAGPVTTTHSLKTEPKTAKIRAVKARSHRLGRGVGFGTLAVALILAGVLIVLQFRKSDNPVPQDIRKQAGFSVYYPQAKKMPSGYAIDSHTFRVADGGVVLFSVTYGSGRSMVFAEQPKPESDVISKFTSEAIPVHNQVTSSHGNALVGAYGSGTNIKTVVSLPITNGPWLIITAPSDINQTELSQVIRSLAK